MRGKSRPICPSSTAWQTHGKWSTRATASENNTETCLLPLVQAGNKLPHTLGSHLFPPGPSTQSSQSSQTQGSPTWELRVDNPLRVNECMCGSLCSCCGNYIETIFPRSNANGGHTQRKRSFFNLRYVRSNTRSPTENDAATTDPNTRRRLCCAANETMNEEVLRVRTL